MNKKTVIGVAVLALVCVLVGVAIGAAVTTYRISGEGTVLYPAKLGVYAEFACSTPVTEIDWGMLSPGDVGKKVVYVRNEGGSPMTLTFSTAAWNPSQTQQYLSLSWNYTSQTVPVNAVVAMQFSLAVSSTLTASSGITNFTFDITISVQGS
jgi:hypothetical protein